VIFFTFPILLAITAGYLCLLFFAAYYAEHRERAGRSIAANPYVYSLSLAVYCTSWTFYGSVGKAATSGISFLTIYLGPTLMVALWWVVMKKVITIAKENRITTIADFIGSRYGNSIGLSALVTVVALVGITPYLGLQIKAIMSTFMILAGEARGTLAAGWVITLMLGVFAIIFGARRLDLSEKHEGLVFAIAFESIVKLAAFLAVGLYVTFWLFGGFGDIFGKLRETVYGELLYMGPGTSLSYSEWGSLLILSMMAIMFLPRQFHVTVVENNDVRHLRTAMWLFPLYLFLINLFVLPVAYGGLLLGGSQSLADSFVLTIPLNQGKRLLALFVFIGGFSAATGMVIVSSLAISNMVMNNLVMPAIYRYNRMKGFPALIINIKRVVIMACVFLGYFFAVSIGEFYTLVDIGLKSFEAVTIFAPAFFLGLYWKRGTRRGAIAGISGGFVIWFYTLIVPALMKAGVIEKSGGALSYVVNSSLLNPHALFGLTGLDKWSHSLFWGLFVNVALYVGVSIFTRQSGQEESQALMFVESYSPRVVPGMRSYDTRAVRDMLAPYIGGREAEEVVGGFMRGRGIEAGSMSPQDFLLLKDEARRVLSGALGSPIASIILEDRLVHTEEERGEILGTIKQMTATLRLSRQEIAEVNRQLQLLKEFSENILESIPLGVTTLDEGLRVRYWNRAMEALTGVGKSEALGSNIRGPLSCIRADLFGPAITEGEIKGEMHCERRDAPPMVLKGYLTRLTGSQRGYVLVLEDVTEKKKIQEELFRTSKHASVGRLAAGVSHEVGNPLASISSLVQELQAEDVSDFVKDSLGTISQHIERIARIVRNLGDFARLYPREKAPTKLDKILESTLNLARYDARFKKIEITTDVREVPELMIDPDQMQQVFLNLILNARDAMPEGGRLGISLRPLDGSVEIAVSDTGSGIDPEIKDHIFDPFFTAKAGNRGTGLGLSISYSIIRDHGGTIDVQSEKGKGTTFLIRLPVKA
jgi:PAS domain S-box-containing protein